MPRSGTERRRLSGQVLVRLTHEQQKAVATRAQAAQVTAAAWLRLLIGDVLSVDPGPTVTRAAPSAFIIEVAHLREVLAEIGGALVQASIAAREEGRPAQHEQIEQLIPQVKAAVRDVDLLKAKLWPRAR
jgi:hypothetical protein